MKQFAGSRKVVIIQNPGKGNIEQAIFIIRKEAVENNEDYIVNEAKKIIDEFTEGQRGSKRKKFMEVWFVPIICIFIFATLYCLYRMI
ncbi:MAG: hypothetical protein Q8873_03150 [Bacillota bacterium]|nr:hypothetical protein [Bacillota bacterium]